MNRITKLSINIALSCFLALSMLAGCQANPTGNPSSQSLSNSEVSSDGTLRGLQLPLTTNGEKLSIACPGYADPILTLSDDLEVFAEIAKKTGVSIDWQISDQGNYDTVMQTKLAAGVNLPDMFVVPNPSTTNVVTLANNSAIIPIDELIKKNAPNMTYYLDKATDVRQAYTFPDKHIYSLPMIFYEDTGMAAAYNNLVLLIRQDWLDKLGLSIPKTTDDYYNVLKAFKTRDPNGNGKADEIPFLGGWSQMGLNTVLTLSWMYGIHPYNNGIYPDNKGNMVSDYTSPAMKSYLQDVSKWFNEGLINPDMMSIDMGKYMGLFSADTVGSLFWFTMGPTTGMNEALIEATNNPKAEYVAITTPTAAGYTGIIENLVGPVSGNFVISKDCKNPELAIKWLDYAGYSDDGINYNHYGIEGKTYNIVNGKPKILDNIKADPNGLFSYGAAHHGSIPIISTTDTMANTWGEDYKNVKYAAELAKMTFSTPLKPSAMPMLDEVDAASAFTTDLDTYRNESLLKFITGSSSIPTDFDKFCTQLNKLGQSQALVIAKAQYDRAVS